MSKYVVYNPAYKLNDIQVYMLHLSTCRHSKWRCEEFPWADDKDRQTLINFALEHGAQICKECIGDFEDTREESPSIQMMRLESYLLRHEVFR